MVEMYLLCRSSSPGIVMRCKDFGCWWWVHAEAPKYKQEIGEGNAPQSQQIRQSRSKRPFDSLVVGVKLFCCCCCFRFLTCQHFEWLTKKIRNNCLTFCFLCELKTLTIASAITAQSIILHQVWHIQFKLITHFFLSVCLVIAQSVLVEIVCLQIRNRVWIWITTWKCAADVKVPHLRRRSCIFKSTNCL